MIGHGKISQASVSKSTLAWVHIHTQLKGSEGGERKYYKHFHVGAHYSLPTAEDAPAIVSRFTLNIFCVYVSARLTGGRGLVHGRFRCRGRISRHIFTDKLAESTWTENSQATLRLQLRVRGRARRKVGMGVGGRRGEGGREGY